MGLRSEITSVSRVAHVLLLRLVDGKGSSMIVIIFTSVHSVRWGGGGGGLKGDRTLFYMSFTVMEMK